MPPGIGYSKRFYRIKKKYKRRYVRRKKIKRRMRKKYYAKSRRRFYKKKKTLAGKLYKHGKAIHSLQRKTKGTTTYFKHRLLGSGILSVAINEQFWFSFGNMSQVRIDQDLSRMPYFDPTVPNALTIADMSTITAFTCNVHVKKSIASLEIMNNYNIPMHIDVYLCTIKADTDKSPLEFITDDITDIGTDEAGAALSLTDPLIYPADCPAANQMYKFQRIASYWHQQGQIRRFTCASYNMVYNYTIDESHDLEFTRRLKSKFILLRVYGPPAHDKLLAGTVGTGECRIDYILRRSNEYEYNGGMAMTRIEVTNNLDTFLNASIVNSKPGAAQEELTLA